MILRLLLVLHGTNNHKTFYGRKLEERDYAIFVKNNGTGILTIVATLKPESEIKYAWSTKVHSIAKNIHWIK